MIAEAKIENNKETIKKFNENNKNNTKNLTWFTINVIATSTGTENK